MEPTEFDNLIQQQLQGKNTVHQNEMDKVQSRIWATVSEEKNNEFNWLPWTAVAAIFLCLLLLPFYYFQNLESEYAQKFELLNEKLEANNYVQSKSILPATDQALCTVIDQLQTELQELKRQKPQGKIIIQTPPKAVTEVIYKTDTIYLQKETVPINSSTIAQLKQSDSANTNSILADYTEKIIFPDYESTNITSKPMKPTIKLIFNPFKNK